MIEQLYRDTKPADRKRKSLTDELQQLASEQEKLEQQRNLLKDSITSATSLLAPLREQMKDVVECMKRFYEMENSYAALSKQTYEDIHNDMQAIGSELLQTQSLLDDGTKLVNSGIELPDMTLPSDLLPKEEKEREVYPYRGISDSEGNEREKETSLDTPDVPVAPVTPVAAATTAPTEDMDSVWTDQPEALDPELSAMLNGLNNRDYENPESDKEATFEPFYDLLKEKLKDRRDVTIVADSEQNSALVEIFMSANEAKLLPDFSLMAEDEKLRIRGNYSNGQLSLDYDDIVSENGVESFNDFVTDATKDSVKALLLSQIEKDLQENRQPVPESSERDL